MDKVRGDSMLVINVSILSNVPETRDHVKEYQECLERTNSPNSQYGMEVEVLLIGTRQRSQLSQEKLGHIDIAIVDISEDAALIFLHIGLLRGLGKPVLLVKSSASFEKFGIPPFITEHVYEYENVSDIAKIVAKEINPLLKPLFKTKADRQFLNGIRGIWFGNNPPNIHIVGPSEAIKTEYAHPISPNYIHMHNFGDNDTIVEANAFLKMLYPETNIFRHPSDNFPSSLYEENLLVIGGPGSLETEGNIVCRKMMEKYDSQIKYPDDKDAMTYKDSEYESIFNQDGYVTQDFGYFARVQNPFNKDRSVVMVSGVHTYGVLGAAKAFSDHANARLNISKVINKFGDLDNIAFETFFAVPVVMGTVLCPEIEIDKLLPIEFKYTK